MCILKAESRCNSKKSETEAKLCYRIALSKKKKKEKKKCKVKNKKQNKTKKT